MIQKIRLFVKIMHHILSLFILFVFSSCSNISDVPEIQNIAVIEDSVKNVNNTKEQKIISSDKKAVSNGKQINTTRWYQVSWSGMHVGDFFTKIKSLESEKNRSDADLYSFQTIIRSYGLVRMINGFQSDTEGLVRHVDDFLPLKYKTSFMMRNKKRDIKIDYSDDGSKIISEYNNPPEKRWKRKAVPDNMKNGSLDPLTLVLSARKKIMEIINTDEKEFSLPLYDGRRYSSIDFTIHKNTANNLIHVSFKEKPIAGYTDNELNDLKDGESVVHLYLSTLDFLPVSAKGSSPLGTANIVLKKKCSTMQECIDSV